MMEQLMDNEGKLKAHDGQNGEWQKNKWNMMENDRKRMEHDGNTHGTCKKANGTWWNN